MISYTNSFTNLRPLLNDLLLDVATANSSSHMCGIVPNRTAAAETSTNRLINPVILSTYIAYLLLHQKVKVKLSYIIVRSKA